MTVRDKIFGWVMCFVALLLGVIYFYLVTTPLWWRVIEVVISIFVLILLVILFWIGWTIANAPTLGEIVARKPKGRK